MDRFFRHIVRTAFLLSAGVWPLFSCGDKKASSGDGDTRNMMTQQSENLTIIHSRNGNVTYRFTTPLLERYENALEPYTEFRKGIHIERYNDSTHLIEATLTANYAIWLEKQELWEAKGNVIGENADGNRLETEQLFWDQKAKRVYSNVDSKITQKNDVIYGDGFESDDRFEEFVVRKPKGKVTVNTTPGERSDSTRTDGKNAAAGRTKPTVPPPADGDTDHPVIREGEAVARPKPSVRGRRPATSPSPVEMEKEAPAADRSRLRLDSRPENESAGQAD